MRNKKGIEAIQAKMKEFGPDVSWVDAELDLGHLGSTRAPELFIWCVYRWPRQRGERKEFGTYLFDKGDNTKYIRQTITDFSESNEERYWFYFDGERLLELPESRVLEQDFLMKTA